MTTELIDFYVAASVARWRTLRRAGQHVVNQPGLYGLLACDEDPRVRLLVTDDEAYAGLVELCGGARAGMVNVFAKAVRCADLLESDPAWKSSPATAMICRDLTAVPRLALPDALRLRAVRRVAEDPAAGVALADAVATVVLADPDEDPETLTAFLRSLPEATHLFAAIDADGIVRATSGWQLSGRDARVLLVDTDPAWRGRGIASAMTSAALHAAQLHGARHATLDASTVARTIYQRLGFESVAQTIRFVPAFS